MAERDIETPKDQPIERTTHERVIRERTMANPKGERLGDDEFLETLAQPIPNRTYRSQIDTDVGPTALEQLVRYVAILLDILLAVRFAVSLFSVNTANSFVAFIFGLTNWLVAPLQILFGSPQMGTNTGYFDWSALAAIIVVSVLASLIVRLLQGPRTIEY
jgi:uncharacterized protein YggT (Ycf19 family)